MSTAPSHAGTHDHNTASDRQSWWILGLIGLAQFMVILDITVVNVALPSIGKAPELSATTCSGS